MRIRDVMTPHFGENSVFTDIDSIPLGVDFLDHINLELSTCDALVAIVGPRWIDAGQGPGQGVHLETDFVRIEVEAALKRKIPVIPALVAGTRMPKTDELPDALRPFAFRNATAIDSGVNFRHDVDRLIRSLDETLARKKTQEKSKAQAKSKIEKKSESQEKGQIASAAPSLVANAPKEPGPAAPSLVDRYRAEGRIKVDATIVHGAPDGWFLPGNGKAEWFKDYDGGPEMVIVPAGKFMMGAPKTELGRSDNEGPQHPVTLAQPFAVGRHAVTRGQFAAFVNNTGYKTEGGAYVRVVGWFGGIWKSDPSASWRNPRFPQDESHPVVCVGWEDAKAFAAWLSSQSGRDYRLLTEAEWEYAARAGTTTPFWWGSTITPAQANYGGGGAKGEFRTVAVEEFAANPWGLYQVHGNVWEWCEDVQHERYDRAPSDGSAWLQGGDVNYRVVRGGSWAEGPHSLRSADRYWYSTVYRRDTLGFRVGRTLVVP
jgi:formylglycine-generating enzyme required for sulfatase activity